jgi:hypothetical protein
MELAGRQQDGNKSGLHACSLSDVWTLSDFVADRIMSIVPAIPTLLYLVYV